jgi:hypothetical protein
MTASLHAAMGFFRFKTSPLPLSPVGTDTKDESVCRSSSSDTGAPAVSCFPTLMTLVP